MTLQSTLFDQPKEKEQENQPVTLRPYQVEAVQKVFDRWYDVGESSTMIAMATGTGKSETFLGVLAAEREAHRFERGLILAHTKELVEQPRDRINRSWSTSLPVPGIVMADQDECSRQIVCATYQTMGSERRLARTLGYGTFSHVVIDECHRANPDTEYERIVGVLREANPSVKILGATATPAGNGIFQSTAYRLSIRKAVRELKCLVEPVGLGVHINLDLSKVKKSGDDFKDDELADAMESSQCERVVYQTWLEHAKDRPTMCFAVSVAHARTLADYFHYKGVAVGFADGTTPKKDRARTVARYQAGEIQVLFNCAIWTEGFNAPHTSAILNVRPTLSPTLYQQIVGRGLRRSEGKENCLIFDFKPTDTARDLMSIGSILERRPSNRTVTKAVDSGVLTSVDTLEQHSLDIEEDLPKIVVRILDLLSNKSSYKWTFDGGFSSCNVNDDCSIVIVHPQPERVAAAEALRSQGNWSPAHDLLLQAVSSYQVFSISKKGQVTLLSRSSDYDPAHEAAESYIEGKGVFASKSASWRSREPSPGLITFAQRLGVYDPLANMGRLSQLVTHRLCRIALAKAGIIR